MAKRVLLLGFAIGSFLLLTGSDGGCGSDGAGSNTTAIECATQSVRVLPGECAELTNPCAGGVWSADPLDSFELTAPPRGITTVTERPSGNVARTICADPAVEVFVDRAVAFEYKRGTERGTGDLLVTTAPALLAAAEATPATIVRGESTRLHVSASGGVAPYTYAWSPADTLDAADVVGPTATPAAPVTYSVTVTDAAGQTAVATVTVGVTDRPVGPGERVITLRTDGGGLIEPLVAGALPCTGDCTLVVPVSTTVRLRAVPGNGWVLDAWSGDCAGSALEVDVVADVDRMCTATFTEVNAPLDVLITPSALLPVPLGTQLTLTAVVDGGQPSYRYRWEAVDRPELVLPDTASIMVGADSTTVYVVHVEDAMGAEGSAQIEVQVEGASGPLIRLCSTFTASNPTCTTPMLTARRIVTLNAHVLNPSDLADNRFALEAYDIVRFEWTITRGAGNVETVIFDDTDPAAYGPVAQGGRSAVCEALAHTCPAETNDVWVFRMDAAVIGQSVELVAVTRTGERSSPAFVVW